MSGGKLSCDRRGTYEGPSRTDDSNGRTVEKRGARRQREKAGRGREEAVEARWTRTAGDAGGDGGAETIIETAKDGGGAKLHLGRTAGEGAGRIRDPGSRLLYRSRDPRSRLPSKEVVTQGHDFLMPAVFAGHLGDDMAPTWH
ncbi:hypothetical protein Scep_001450 [Stephania cephalantha]|uniref:Uncharacterized protein n=1 Tax=Stephania cephalantha TaxID=152367 RepID=A0AAP0LC10_9MAGN